MGRLRLIFLIIAIISIGTLMGQTKTDSVFVQKKGSTVFYQHGVRLSPLALLKITKGHANAYEMMEKAKVNYDFAYGLSLAGGFCIGWPIGTMLGGGDPAWALLGVGAGLIAISIPLSIAYGKHAKKAVNLYNEDVSKTSYETIDFNIGFTAQGIGLQLIF